MNAIEKKLSFLEWLSMAVPLEQTAVFVVAGLAGMVGHYVKLWAAKEIDTCLWAYLTKENPRRTVLAVMGFMSAAATYALSGQLAETPWGTLIGAALTTGYSADSLLNKGSTK